MSKNSNTSISVVFMGTSPFAGESLRHLIRSGIADVQLVVSQPDKPKGRKLQLLPTPVKEVALEHGLSVKQPIKSRAPEFVDELRALTPDLIVVAAYGQILPQSILDIPKHGCLNVHGSLLPRHRGAAPIQWAILDGDAETGITIMKMDAGLDTGDIVSKRSTSIDPGENAQVLHDRLAQIGGELLVESIPPFVRGEITPKPQPDTGATYARKLSKDDGIIDWSQPAERIHNQIRALCPWPGASTTLKSESHDGPVRIWKTTPSDPINLPAGSIQVVDRKRILVACGSGTIELFELQLPGSRRLDASAFLAGHPLRNAVFATPSHTVL